MPNPMHMRLTFAAALVAASMAAAKTTKTSTSARPSGTTSTAPGSDTAYNRSYWDSTAGGTGPGSMPGRGGSSMDSGYTHDSLWSSPYGSPATPGTGLPNAPGNAAPGTGTQGSKGTGGSGMGDSTLRAPAPVMPRTDPLHPSDSIGAPDWLERG